MGKCFDDDTKAAQTPTLQISSLLSGAQYCHFAPSVFFAYGLGHPVSSMASNPSFVEAVVL